MTAIARRSLRAPVSIAATLATADDLDGTLDNTQAFDVTGAARVIIVQSTGTAGTAGIDIFQVSHDGGETWAADPTVMAAASNDVTGDILAAGALNAAGVDPVPVSVFKAGPYSGPTAIRVARKTTDSAGTTWITGSPGVVCLAIGKTSGALTALA